ncbi:MAG: hypothetical protein KDA70_07615, partial [Planctomycetaceae bacterium]|nr:hypothetical protein [Planctomycetaceae bacterium]
MREDIAEAYRKMQENPAPMIFSKLPEETDSPEEQESRSTTATMTGYSDRDDDDFVLDQSIAVTEYEASDDDFQLSGDMDSGQDDQTTIPLAREESEDEARQHAEAEEKSKTLAAEEKAKQIAEAPAEDHSVATGGDVLFNVAIEEEKEEKKRRKGGGRRRRRRGAPIEGGIV